METQYRKKVKLFKEHYRDLDIQAQIERFDEFQVRITDTQDPNINGRRLDLVAPDLRLRILEWGYSVSLANKDHKKVRQTVLPR